MGWAWRRNVYAARIGNSSVPSRLATPISVSGINISTFFSDWHELDFVLPRGEATIVSWKSSFLFYASKITQLWPDPLRPANDNDIGTLRVAFDLDLSDHILVEEYLENSVLSGFASIGGLWAFITGVFAAIFGTSIMKVLFGTQRDYITCFLSFDAICSAIKPLSVFGFIHYFQKNRLQGGCIDRYPQVQQDLNTARKPRPPVFSSKSSPRCRDLGNAKTEQP